MDAVLEELRETSGLIIGLIMTLVIMGLIGYALTNVHESIVSPVVQFIKKMVGRK
ncbi:hypothetical protein [Peribacillus frigoritolerans]|uniref:hypothetical protein n=1 Tax=Peribacillus frigoritolerans TaxID=450367 RepID=UPI002079C373|nr:hypothetical protein [Peribacillus frigoritolerans]USK74601.1 hypothetical protein LIT31_23090 [Peribacillus frigoritolerans]